jgi:hypothetical protein
MKLKLILLCAAVLSLGAVSAYAAIPNSTNGSITACADSHGALKVIDAEAGVTCASGKKTLTFRNGLPIGAIHTVTSESAEISNTFRSKSAFCPAGTAVTGGGGSTGASANTDPYAPIVLTRSIPNGNGWFVTAMEVAPYDSDWKLIVYAECVNVS